MCLVRSFVVSINTVYRELISNRGATSRFSMNTSNALTSDSGSTWFAKPLGNEGVTQDLLDAPMKSLFTTQQTSLLYVPSAIALCGKVVGLRLAPDI